MDSQGSKSRSKEPGLGHAKRPAVTIDLVRRDEIRAAHTIEAACLEREEVTHLSQLMYVSPFD